jgi:hypothetical protein
VTPFHNPLAVTERAAIRAHVRRLKRRADLSFTLAVIFTAASIPSAYALGMLTGTLLSH